MHLNLYLLISVFARTIFALSPSEIIGSLDTLTVAANKITPLLNEIVADTKSQDILVCFSFSHVTFLRSCAEEQGAPRPTHHQLCRLCEFGGSYAQHYA
jgi:hypothetical protein